jgi:hypothetical protein
MDHRAQAFAELCIGSWKDCGLTDEQILSRLSVPNPADDEFARGCEVDPNLVRRLMRLLVVH